MFAKGLPFYVIITNMEKRELHLMFKILLSKTTLSILKLSNQFYLKKLSFLFLNFIRENIYMYSVDIVNFSHLTANNVPLC